MGFAGGLPFLLTLTVLQAWLTAENVDLAGFTAVYLLLAGIMVLMAVTSLFAPEPISSPDRPRSLRDAFVDPFVEFFQRHDAIRNGAIILAFILVYNLGINLSNHMTIPFFLTTGFSNTEIGAVTTFFGIGPYLFGVFVGGVIQLRTGLFRALVFTALAALPRATLTAPTGWMASEMGWVSKLTRVIEKRKLSGGANSTEVIPG